MAVYREGMAVLLSIWVELLHSSVCYRDYGLWDYGTMDHGLWYHGLWTIVPWTMDYSTMDYGPGLPINWGSY